MRILFVVSVPSLQGSNISLLNLITALRKDGHECGLLASRNGYLIDKLEAIGVKCGIIRYRASLYPTTATLRDKLLYIPLLCLLSENIINYGKVKQFIKKFAPDIIHTNVSTIDIGYKAAKELNIPHIWHIREYMDLDFNVHPFPTMISRKKELSDSYTISITKDIRSHFNLEENPKAHVIYNGILKATDLYYQNSKEKYFLYAAFLQPCKGIYDLLKAYASHVHQRPETPYRLKLMGGYTPDVYNNIINFIKEKGIDERVDIMGKVEPRVVNEHLKCASVTFIPSLSEGFGRTMAEAMFNGCLVAGRNTGGTKEQFDNGLSLAGREIGIRFNTVEEMTAIMNHIYEEGISKYEDMTLSSQKVVSQLYTIESNHTQILNLYKTVLDERS